jgi:adenine-specific DNA-methyltransferase
VRVRKETVVLREDDGEIEVPADDLVVVAEFGEPIYPGFRRLGRIDRGGEKPAHVVINAENYHALQTLRFSHTGKVGILSSTTRCSNFWEL